MKLAAAAVLALAGATAAEAHGHHHHHHDPSLISEESIDRHLEEGHGKGGCGTKDPEVTVGISDDLAKAHAQAVLRSIEQQPGGASRRGLGVSSVTIPIQFHAIFPTAQQGNLPELWANPQATFEQEVADLNAAYADHAIQFSFAGHSVTYNNEWAAGCQSQEAAFKEALHVDPLHNLNMYYTDCASEGLYGFATFPPGIEDGTPPEDSYMQGVVNDLGTVRGGSACEGGCEGDTAVHEIGHYLGLYHIFEKGCQGHGDEVSDTPTTSAAKYGTCSTSDQINSCNDGDGWDMVWNFMDYGDDTCLSSFTEMQGYRMLWAVSKGRPNLLSTVADSATTCVAGSYFDGSQCAACPVGHYNALHGQTSCTACPAPESEADEGAWAFSNTGAASVYECKVEGTVCQAGWYSDGYCDAGNNNAECTWDGGDCCSSTCISGDYACGTGDAGTSCLDPNASDGGGLSDGLSGGATAGLVCGLVGATLVGVAVFVARSNGKFKKAAANEELPTVTQNPAFNAAAAAAAVTETFQIAVPVGVVAGQTIQARSPNGRTVNVQIPAGLAPGSTIQVQA